MELTVYLDVFWIRSFLIELCVCIFVNLWMKQECKALVMICGCGLAVTAEVIVFVMAGYHALYVIAGIGIRLLELLGIFRPGHFGLYCRLVVWSMLATVAMGGILVWLEQWMWREMWFPVGIAVVSMMILISVVQEERRRLHDVRLYPVVMRYQDHQVACKAFYDTGNRLRDPYVQQPVMIVSEHIAGQMVLDENKSRLVPITTVGMPDGLIRVWSISEIKLKKQHLSRPVIGVADEELFSGKDYQAILPADWQCYL